MAGSVIQVTGTVEFEDGLWIGNHQKARNGLQRVCSILGVRPGAVCTTGFPRGQTEFQFTWVHVAASCHARRQVWFPAAAVLGLTWPREVGTIVLFPDVRQKPLMGYPLPSFGKASIQNKQTYLLRLTNRVYPMMIVWPVWCCTHEIRFHICFQWKHDERSWIF